MVSLKAETDESMPKSENVNKKTVVGPGFFTGKRLLLASIYVAALFGVVAKYVYEVNDAFYVNQMEERTLLPQSHVNFDRKAWVIRDHYGIFTLGSWHSTSLLFDVFIRWNDDTTHEDMPTVYQKQWIEGDGKSFGKLSVSSETLNVTIQFVTLGESWTVRVSAKRNPRMPTANHTLRLFLHSPAQDPYDSRHFIRRSDNFSKLLSGYNTLMGKYSIAFDTLGSETTKQGRYMCLNCKSHGWEPLPFDQADVTFDIRDAFDVEIAFSTEDSKKIVANDFGDLYKMNAGKFEEKFEKTYNLKSQNMSEFHQSMGISALTNVLSSMKYSYYSVKGKSKLNPEFDLGKIESISLADGPVRTPSKLNDQVFSLLTILPFETDKAIQIITSWLNLMNLKGDVPTELFVERMDYPYGLWLDYTSTQAPTVFYIIDRILRTEDVTIFQDIYPKIEAFARNMIITHTSFEKNLFKWTANPTFLSDYERYPYGQKANDRRSLKHMIVLFKQANLDLHCWMVIASRVMKKLSVLGNNQYQYEQWNIEIDNQEFLLANYYDEEKKVFADTFMTTQNNKQVRGFMSDATGFVSISPLVFELLPAESPHLKRILEAIDNQEGLFSSFGIRSLSKSSSHYVTEHPESSYRSDISIPANYLLLGALKHYSEKSSDNQALAHVVYSKLRNTIISNVAREFKRTKTLWETYSDTNGRGKGKAGHNWSALVLNIMAEKY